jgi:hypothetical protein
MSFCTVVLLVLGIVLVVVVVAADVVVVLVVVKFIIFLKLPSDQLRVVTMVVSLPMGPFLIFFSTFREMVGQYRKISHDNFLSNPSQFINR